MARVQLIICDKCKKSASQLFSLEVLYRPKGGNPSTFEICEDCSKELIEICTEAPEVYFEKKNKPVYRGNVESEASSEPVRKRCKHENQEYEDPGKLICLDCGHVSKS